MWIATPNYCIFHPDATGADGETSSIQNQLIISNSTSYLDVLLTETEAPNILEHSLMYNARR